MYCGDRPPHCALVIDHYVPVALGGSSETFNLITACEECNTGKSDKEMDAVCEDCVSPGCGGPQGFRTQAEYSCKCYCHRCEYCGDMLWCHAAVTGLEDDCRKKLAEQKPAEEVPQ
jgi:hypothetical protein